MTSTTCSAAIPPDASAPTGTVAGHYQLRTRIAEGGYGEVYEAWDSQLQRSVAIKRIKDVCRTGGADPVHEARMAASLRHAAFVKVHAIEDTGMDAAIVMELVDGRTLKQVIDAGGIVPASALDWAAQIAEAMQDAHDSGLVHGDLKPSNLMVEPGGRVRILDFGLSARYDPLATGGPDVSVPLGTIAYMAPECLLGQRPDARSDMYALGVVLYEMLCGARPHGQLEGLTLAAARIQSSSAHWTYPDTLGTPLVALVKAMTAQQPTARLASMAQVRKRLAAIARPMPVSPVAARLPAHRWRLAAAVLASLLALAGGVHLVAPLPAPVMPFAASQELQRGLDALRVFDRRGSLEQAGRHFAAVLAHQPDNAAAAAGTALVHALRYRGDTQDEIWLRKADASAQQAMQLDDQLALAHVARGWVLDGFDRHDAALQQLDQALRLDPADFFAWFGKVQVLRHARRYPEALAALAVAARRFPRERAFMDELGSVHYEMGDYRLAEQAFRRSIALQPDAVTGYSNLNAALLRQDRGDEAMQMLQQGLRVRPSAALYGNLGNALFLRGDYLSAAAAFEDAVSPIRGAPGEYLNWANLADTLLWIPGREDQARQAYGKARQLLAPILQRAPNDATLVSRMALYAARGGDGGTAAGLLARATQLAPRDAGVHFRAALSYEILGRRDMALHAIAMARQLGYPASFIDAEPDLVSLRRDPRYASADFLSVPSP